MNYFECGGSKLGLLHQRLKINYLKTTGGNTGGHWTGQPSWNRQPTLVHPKQFHSLSTTILGLNVRKSYCQETFSMNRPQSYVKQNHCVVTKLELHKIRNEKHMLKTYSKPTGFVIRICCNWCCGRSDETIICKGNCFIKDLRFICIK